MMTLFRLNAIDFVFSRKHKIVAPATLKELERHINQNLQVKLKLKRVHEAYWFDLREEYLEENEIPIRVEASFVDPKSKVLQAVTYVYFDLKTGSLSKQVDVDIDETEIGDLEESR